MKVHAGSASQTCVTNVARVLILARVALVKWRWVNIHTHTHTRDLHNSKWLSFLLCARCIVTQPLASNIMALRKRVWFLHKSVRAYCVNILEFTFLRPPARWRSKSKGKFVLGLACTHQLRQSSHACKRHVHWPESEISWWGRPRERLLLFVHTRTRWRIPKARKVAQFNLMSQLSCLNGRQLFLCVHTKHNERAACKRKFNQLRTSLRAFSLNCAC